MKDWMENLPEALKASETLDQYDSADAALQGLIDTKSAMGGMLRIPGDGASDDDLAAFNTKLLDKVPTVMLRPDMDNAEQSKEFFRSLGVPAEADKYRNPEGLQGVAPEQEAGLRNAALAMNMTQAQYQKAISTMADSNTTTAEGIKTAQTEAMDRLRGEWGSAYDQRMAMAKKLHETNFGDTGIPFENVDPAALRGLYMTAKALTGEGGTEFAKQPTGEKPALSPDEAQLQITEIMNNKKHPWNDVTSPGHKAAVKKMLALQAAAAGRADEGFMNPVTSLRLGGI